MAGTDTDGHWVISVEDRAKHNAQFEQLKPVNGFVGGDQVRPLLMKSGLPLPVLGHVWNLADINGDGKMDQHEFSVAIHLIRKRLQGVSLPKTLPASLKAGPATTPSPPPTRPVAQAPNVTPQVAAVSSPPTVAVATTPAAAAVVTVPPATTNSSSSLPVNKAPPSVSAVASSPPTSAVVSPPCSQPPPKSSDSVTQPGVLTVASPPKASEGQDGSGVVWAISQAECARYNQMFLTFDQKKKGYLTGLQDERLIRHMCLEARDILSKSGLSVKLLAVIWNLADIDGDGRLTKDEFFVAMYYVDMAKSGKPLPSTLPPEVVPPSCRKPAAVPASIVSPAVATAAEPVAAPVAATVAAPVEKPVSLPRPTSKPPSDVTRVPAIQPPSVAGARRPVTVTTAPSAPAVTSVAKPAAVDPFGMDPCAFNSTAPLFGAPLVPVAGASTTKEVTVVETSSPIKEKPVEAVSTVTAEDKSKTTAAVSRVLSPPTTAQITSTEKSEETKSDAKITSPVHVDNKQSAADQAAQLEQDADNRRKALQEQMQREQEEHRKKLQEQFEREKEEQTRLFKEQMEKEKEAQRKLLMEMMEKEREEQKRKLIEQKEAAKREMERQRQIEWEQQRKVQLDTLKHKEANLVEKLDRDISKLKIELASLDDRKADLGGKTDKFRNVVSDFTSAIEQMRLIRDQKMADINRVQIRIEDSNKRALSAEQDQVQLSMQLQTFKQCHADAFKVMVNSCNTKKAVVDQLKEQLISIDKDTTSRLQLIDSNCSKISELKLIASDVYAQIKQLEDAISQKRAEWNAKKNAENGAVGETWRQGSESGEKDDEPIVTRYKAVILKP